MKVGRHVNLQEICWIVWINAIRLCNSERKGISVARISSGMKSLVTCISEHTHLGQCKRVGQHQEFHLNDFNFFEMAFDNIPREISFWFSVFNILYAFCTLISILFFRLGKFSCMIDLPASASCVLLLKGCINTPGVFLSFEGSSTLNAIVVPSLWQVSVSKRPLSSRPQQHLLILVLS